MTGQRVGAVDSSGPYANHESRFVGVLEGSENTVLCICVSCTAVTATNMALERHTQFLETFETSTCRFTRFEFMQAFLDYKKRTI